MASKTEHLILPPEIMTPIADAMCFIHGKAKKGVKAIGGLYSKSRMANGIFTAHML
jgi:hypothetical protein